MRSLRHSTASTRHVHLLVIPRSAATRDLHLLARRRDVQIPRYARDDMESPRSSVFGPRSSVLTLLVLTILIPATLRAQDGKVVYDKWCAGCHGDTGPGDGFGAKTMLPHPRDFTKAVYKIRTTASGEIPTDDDLRHVIEVGMPGTAMPEWKSRLSGAEITAVIQYLKSFSPNSFKGTAAKAIAIGKAPSGSGVRSGREESCRTSCSSRTFDLKYASFGSVPDCAWPFTNSSERIQLRKSGRLFQIVNTT